MILNLQIGKTDLLRSLAYYFAYYSGKTLFSITKEHIPFINTKLHTRTNMYPTSEMCSDLFLPSFSVKAIELL